MTWRFHSYGRFHKQSLGCFLERVSLKKIANLNLASDLQSVPLVWLCGTFVMPAWASTLHPCGSIAVTCVSKSIQVQQALQVFNIVNSRPQCLHLVESFVFQLLWQMLSEPRIAFTYAVHSLPLSFVPFADECLLEGVITHPRGPWKGK